MLNHPIDLEEMTAEQAIQATIDMWTDMMERLGEDPGMRHRIAFKEAWLLDHGYTGSMALGSVITGNCFLCEYAAKRVIYSAITNCKCHLCPIYWPDRHLDFHFCKGHALDYRKAPIPDILAYLKNKKVWTVEENDESSV